MIEELTIRDLGVIGEATLPLGAGFTALTGETGAGKTMVVTALGLLLGERADGAAVRAGAAQADIEGRWRVHPDAAAAERVREAGGDATDGELILSRAVSAEGRSKAVVGGRAAPVGVLAELGEQLVVVHGQSDQARLRSATAQREALDRFAGSPLAEVLADYQDAFGRWQAGRAELDVLVAERDRRAREAEELRAAITEIEQAQPQPGEDAALAERAERLGNLEELRLAAAQARELLTSENDDPDAGSALAAAQRAVERVAGHDPALAPIAEAIASAGFQVAEAALQLSGYLADLDTDGGQELESVQERRALLADLIRRHGPTLDEVIERLDTGSARLLELDQDADRIEQLEAEVERSRQRLIDLAGRLSEIRREAAARLSAAVSEELTALAMPHAELTVDVTDRGEYGHSGADAVTLLLRPHPGAEPRPVAKGASGGELSRVMLAIEVVLAASDPVPTFVFDEVDAGVGGASATEIGRRLARLARSAQVIVVTHLAQVAAFSTNHLVVEKDTDGSVTASSVRLVHAEERTAEMARLLSGRPDSEAALAHARELLDEAHSDSAD